MNTDLLSLTDILLVSGDVAYDWDLRRDHITWYGAWEKFFDGQTAPPDTSEKFYQAIYDEDRHLVFGAEEQSIDRQYRLKTKKGVTLWVHERSHTEVEQDQVVRQRGVLRYLERVTDKIYVDSSYGRDSLTGCFDRSHMRVQIDKMLQASKFSRNSFAYLVIGVDKMSLINAAVGMESGDALLRGVVERLTSIVPNRAILGRVGGDMFGILLPRPMGDEIKMVAEHILQSFRHQPVMTPTQQLHITVSIGGIRLPSIAKSATEAMIFAEQALHDAHQRGRNLFTEYTDEPERAQGNRQLLELGERIRYAFKHGGFRLAYQPVIDTRTGKTEFYEALVRMFADDGSQISAALFVPAIEQMGLAYELDSTVLDLAVREMEAYPDIHVAINVSGLTASHADWSAHVTEVLQNRPQVAKRMIVEITETAALADIEETKRFVKCFCDLGGVISLDDFGAGATSISYLRSLSLEIMKLDKELLKNILSEPEQQHVVKVLITLAHGLGLRVVAEGIETADVADWMRDADVDLLQGYYYGKPLLDPPWRAKSAQGDAVTATANNNGQKLAPPAVSSVIV